MAIFYRLVPAARPVPVSTTSATAPATALIPVCPVLATAPLAATHLSAPAVSPATTYLLPHVCLPVQAPSTLSQDSATPVSYPVSLALLLPCASVVNLPSSSTTVASPPALSPTTPPIAAVSPAVRPASSALDPLPPTAAAARLECT